MLRHFILFFILCLKCTKAKSPSKDDNENIWELVKDTQLVNC